VSKAAFSETSGGLVKHEGKTDCGVLNDGFPAIPATGKLFLSKLKDVANTLGLPVIASGFSQLS
jgi:hypothetical protein